MSSPINQVPLNEIPCFSFSTQKCSELASSLIKRVQELVMPLFSAIQEMFAFLCSWCYKAEEVSPLNVSRVLPPSLLVEGERSEEKVDSDADSMGSEVTVRCTNSPVHSPDLFQPIEQVAVARKVELLVSGLSDADQTAVNSLVSMKKAFLSKRSSTLYATTKESVYALKGLDVLSYISTKKDSLRAVRESIKWKAQLTAKLSTELSAETENVLQLRALLLAQVLESDTEKVQNVAVKIQEILAAANGPGVFDYVCSYES